MKGVIAKTGIILLIHNIIFNKLLQLNLIHMESLLLHLSRTLASRSETVL